MFYNLLFPQYCRDRVISLLILALRLFFGILFFSHGLDKMINFNELSYAYPSVLGFGSYMTLMLSIFSEFACSIFLIAGLLVRITVIPMIAAMAVAFFDIHDGMFPDGELSLIYLVLFVILYITGPGRYSFDYLIDMKFQKEKNAPIGMK
jgi:putative oxidoreductase